jgi:hypothetical protein
MKASLEQGSSMGMPSGLGQVFAPEQWERQGTTADNGTLQNPELEWQAAIASLSAVMDETIALASLQTSLPCSTTICQDKGVILSGPVPVFSDLSVYTHFKNWIFTSAQFVRQSFQLPPALTPQHLSIDLPFSCILLNPEIVSLQERFCIVLTPTFAWVGWLGKTAENSVLEFHFSFSPSKVQCFLERLANQVQDSAHLKDLKKSLQRFSPISPDYRIPELFSRGLLHWMSQTVLSSASTSSAPRRDHQDPLPPLSLFHKPLPTAAANAPSNDYPTHQLQESSKRQFEALEIELFQALAHELRTPLATIQTLTRLLLKRSDLPAEAERRIEAIQRECRRQIERFGLMFKAIELTHSDCHPSPSHLLPTSLQQVFAENLERWQAQAARRNLTLEVTTPENLPAIAIGDPELLDQVLTGLIEYLSNLSEVGSHLHLHVSLAGEQLKLEFRTNSPLHSTALAHETSMLKAIGQLLMLQTETGSLSLSLRATKQLFRVLGGKLTVRQHPQGEVFAIFLPIGQ